MAIDKTDLLFKKVFSGTSITDTSKQYFEESYVGKPLVFGSQIWLESGAIPTTAPSLSDQATSGVVKYWDKKELSLVAGTNEQAYQHNDLINTIPFNFGDGSYAFSLFKSDNTPISLGESNWTFDVETGTLFFHDAEPSSVGSGNLPKISVYQYVGKTLNVSTVGTAGQVLKVNSGATGLEWGAGGGISSDTNIDLDNDVKVIFGDAGEYIKGDGTDLKIVSSGNIDFDGGDVTFDNQRISGVGRITFNDGGTCDVFRDEDDMVSDDDKAIASQQSIKAYVDKTQKFILSSAFYQGSNSLKYIPLAGGSTSEQSSIIDYTIDDTNFVIPYNLKIEKIYLNATKQSSGQSDPGTTRFKLYKNGVALSNNVTVNVSPVGYDTTDLHTVYTFDFSSETNTYSAGDVMQISIDPTNTLYYCSITIAGKYT